MASQCNRKKNFVRVSIYLKQKRNARKYTVHFRKHEQNKRLNARKQKNLKYMTTGNQKRITLRKDKQKPHCYTPKHDK